MPLARPVWTLSAIDGRRETGRSRPRRADWYRIAPPGWFAGEGWSLTPETGGVAGPIVPPTVRITAAGREIAQFQPDGDFVWTVTVPADDVARAAGAIAIEPDPVSLPGPAEGTADERHLGLRLHEFRVAPGPVIDMGNIRT